MASIAPLLRPFLASLLAAALFPLFLTIMVATNPHGGVDWRSPTMVPVVRWFWLAFVPLATAVAFLGGLALSRMKPGAAANRWLLAAIVAVAVSLLGWLAPVPESMLPVSPGELRFYLAVLGAMVGAGAYRMGFERDEE
jgi:hypothetical protein